MNPSLFLTAAITVGLVAWSVHSATTLPVVLKSWPEKECVQVHPGPHTCSNLPDKYLVKYVGHKWHTNEDLPSPTCRGCATKEEGDE